MGDYVLSIEIEESTSPVGHSSPTLRNVGNPAH